MGNKKTHLVAWEKICTNKDNGGLGLRKMRGNNEAFLMKQLSIWSSIKIHYGQGLSGANTSVEAV